MESKKKILIFIDWYLPGFLAGGPIQSCKNLIEHLKDDFEFSVIARDTDYMSNTPYTGINSDQWNILADGTRVYYFSSSKLSQKNIHALLKQEPYDCVYLNGIFSKYFTIIPLHYLRKNTKKRVVVVSRGMLAENALSIKKWKKLVFLFFTKQFNLFGNVIFHATNEEEKKNILNIFGPDSSVIVAPNLSRKRTLNEWKEKSKPSNNLRLISIARIAPEKNIKYAIEVLRDVKCNVQFDLYGPVYDENYWNDCIRTIQGLPENIKVAYKGSIENRNVPEFISKYDFLFLPTQGENFGHIILEAMSEGLPVIISDRTMWRGLENKNAGWDIPLSEKNKFIVTIEKCAKLSQYDYDILSKGAYDFVQAYFKNKELVEKNKQLFLK